MLLTNAKIITMEETGTLENGFVQMQDGIIRAVGPMEDCPADSYARNLRGAVVLPGFVDAHTHLGMWEDALRFEGDDGNEDTDPCTPHLRALDAVNPMDRCFSEALASGVTAVLTGPGSANPIAGQIVALSTYGRRVDDMVLATPVGIKFALGENPKFTYHDRDETPVTRMATAAIIREQLLKAKRYLVSLEKAEADPDVDKPELDFKCEALLPLLRRKCKAHFHAHRADDIFTAIRIAREFDLDYVIVHGTDAGQIADLLAAEGAPVLAGPILCDRGKPELKNLSPETPAVLARVGVPVGLITDHPETPIQYLSLCAAISVENGMDPTEALRSITCLPAQIAGVDHLVGSIRPGKRADLLVFGEKGRQSRLLAKPDLVFVGGKLVIGGDVQ